MKENLTIDRIRGISGYLLDMMLDVRSLHALNCNNGFAFSFIVNMFSNQFIFEGEKRS